MYRTAPERESLHLKMDCFDAIRQKSPLDFIGAHPPCTYLANSGVRWLTSKKPKDGYEWSDKYQIYINPVRWDLMVKGAEFFKSLLKEAQIAGKGYVENPVIHKYALEIIGERATQVIQPYQFGHMETKATCLWLVGVPKLQETNNVFKQMMELSYKERCKIHYASPGKDRAKIRSKSYWGIAEAMADQWT